MTRCARAAQHHANGDVILVVALPSDRWRLDYQAPGLGDINQRISGNGSEGGHRERHWFLWVCWPHRFVKEHSRFLW
jgi:hypothetical protein